MTLVVYTNGPLPSTAPRHRRRLTGTAHRGPGWVSAVHVLRADPERGRACWLAPLDYGQPGRLGHYRSDPSELDSKALHVLRWSSRSSSARRGAVLADNE